MNELNEPMKETDSPLDMTYAGAPPLDKRSSAAPHNNTTDGMGNNDHMSYSTASTVCCLSSEESSICSNERISLAPADETTTSPPQSARRRKKKSSSNKNKNKKNKNDKNTNKDKKKCVVSLEMLSEKEQSKYVAMDCEMVGVGENGLTSTLARVVVVDFNGKTLLDAYVRPQLPVTDYRTFVSGITEADLKNPRAWDFEKCRNKVMRIIRNKILVGHGLDNDLRVLRIRRPWYMIRDTALYEPFMKVRTGVLWPRKLRDLAREFLQRDIQMPGQPHCPYEDAVAAMDLFQTVRREWEVQVSYQIREMERQKQAMLQMDVQKQQQMMYMHPPVILPAPVPACYPYVCGFAG